MGFIRIEDRMPEGPKFDGIPSAAGWLHVCAMTYTSRALTDGFVPAARVHKLTEDPPVVVNRAIQWLTTPRPGCSNPLWHAVKGGWEIHDYADEEFGNPTRAGAEKARAKASEAGKASAKAREERFGTAQPNSKPRTSPERPVRDRSEQGVRGSSEQAVGTAPEPRPAPSRTTPTPTTEPDGSSVEGFSPKAASGDNARARRLASALSSRTEDPDVMAYAERFMQHAGRAPSGDDLEFFRRVPYECSRLGRSVILAAIDEVAGKHVGQGKPMPRARYLAGKLADLQAAATDVGVTRRSPLNGHASSAGEVLRTLAPLNPPARDVDDDDG